MLDASNIEAKSSFACGVSLFFNFHGSFLGPIFFFNFLDCTYKLWPFDIYFLLSLIE